MCVCVFTPQAVCFYAVSIFNVCVNTAVYECLSVCMMHDVLFTPSREKERLTERKPMKKGEMVARQIEKEKQRHLASEREDKSDEERR